MKVCWHIHFDRFYVMTKFILPSIGELQFSKLHYDNTCTYLDNKMAHNSDTRKHMLDLVHSVRR